MPRYKVFKAHFFKDSLLDSISYYYLISTPKHCRLRIHDAK